MNKLVLCLSGGLDSSVTAALLRNDFDLYPLFFDYDQVALKAEHRAVLEVSAALHLREPEIARVSCWPYTRTEESALSPFLP